MTTNKTISIEDQIEGFRALVEDDEKAEKQFTTDTRSRRASMIAKAYKLSLEWLSLEDPSELTLM